MIDFESLLPAHSATAGQAEFRARLIQILNSQGEILPAAESPLGRLWQLVHSERSTIEECVDVIALDPALTSRVFRLANSVAYEGHVKTLKEAVFFLGLAEIRQAAFNAGVFAQFSKIKLPAGWNHFWIRNIFISRLAERLCGLYFPPTGMEYLAGLLHDTGWIFLAAFFPTELRQILASSLELDEAERKILSFSHADVAALIATRSHLPRRVVKAIAYHQNPSLDRHESVESPAESAKFLGVTLNLCASLADCCEMQMFGQKGRTVEEIDLLPETRWLSTYGPKPDFVAALREELPKAQELHATFFAEHP